MAATIILTIVFDYRFRAWRHCIVRRLCCGQGRDSRHASQGMRMLYCVICVICLCVHMCMYALMCVCIYGIASCYMCYMCYLFVMCTCDICMRMCIFYLYMCMCVDMCAYVSVHSAARYQDGRVNKNIQNDNGDTPLMRCCEGGSID